MQSTHVLVFGSNQEGVKQFTHKIKELCKTKGINFAGPIRHDPIWNFSIDKGYVEEEYVWLGRYKFNTSEVKRLRGKSVYSWTVVIYGQTAAHQFLLDSELPENTRLKIKMMDLDEETPDGKTPFSYDPAQEYTAEL